MSDRVPAECSPPDEYISEEICARGWLWWLDSTAAVGWSAQTMRDVSEGRAPITPELAADLARVFGTSAEYWLGLQQQYDARREGQ